MKFNALIPELTVTSLDVTKHFYVEILGFTIAYERPEDRFAFLCLEENQMMFEEENGHWVTGTLAAPFGRGINFQMTVTDVEALYHKVLSAGIRPFRPLTVSRYRADNALYEQKEFLVQDPDGYLLRFTD